MNPVPSKRKKTPRSVGPASPAQGRAGLERLSVRSFGLTDRGRVRHSNEDQFLVAVLAQALRVQQSSLPQAKMHYGDDRGHLYVVADGVGGQQSGEEASALAVDLIEQFALNTLRWCFRLRGGAGPGLLAEFQEALRKIDAEVCREAARHPALGGMGTTLTVAYSYLSRLYVAHVGDSRCYLFRAGELHQLTSDHTLAQELARRAGLQPGDVRHSRLRHLITNVVGGPEPGVQPELHRIRLQAGDVVLLCSDGLTGMVPDADIAATLAAEADPSRACKRLVAEANARGGRDNVTVIVTRYDAPTPRRGQAAAGRRGAPGSGSRKR